MWSRFRTPKSSHQKRKESGKIWNSNSPTLSAKSSDHKDRLDVLKANVLASSNKIATLEEQAEILKIEREASRITAKSSAKAMFEILEERKMSSIELRAEKMAWKAIATAYMTRSKEGSSKE